MMHRTLLSLAPLAFAFATPAMAAHHEEMPDPLHVTVIDAAGQAIGMAVFDQTPAGVLVDIDVEGLEPGEHAFHIHETGTCEPGEGFSTAGGHYNPAETEHGMKVKAGQHAGDMPNQFVSADGKLRAQVLNDAVSLMGGDGDLFDADGSALVIHAGADDYESQPSGDAGSRVACAVIAAPQA